MTDTRVPRVDRLDITPVTPNPAAPRRRVDGWRIARTSVIVLGAIVMFFPFLWMVSTSLASDADVFATPPKLFNSDLSSYRRLLADFPIGRWVVNSAVVAVIGTTAQVLTSAMAAYAFARLKFKGRDALFALYLTTLMVPFQVLVVPLFIETRMLGLVDSFVSLLLPSIAWPFGTFLFRQAFLALPRELEEAAFVEGASHWKVFWKIILPLSKPVLATGVVLAFMGIWNAFLWPLVAVNSAELMTLPLGLANLQGRFVTQWNLVLAGATLSVLPIVAVYLFVQRYVIEGVASTGIKG
jgi:multiple sugar transport system permease protein